MSPGTAGRLEAPVEGSYQLKRSDVERRGRWHSGWRSLSVVLVGVAAMLPVWAVCRGWLPADGVRPVASARLALALGVVLIPCYVQFGYRCWELVQNARSPRLLRRAAHVGLVLVIVAAALHLVKIAILWPAVASAQAYPVSFATGGLFRTGIVLLGVGLVLSMLAAGFSDPAVWWHTAHGYEAQKAAPWWMRRVRDWPWLLEWARRRLRDGEEEHWRTLLADEPPAATPEVEGTVICCSGGGVRSASFCLGALQELQARDRYTSAKAVVGVSGGGYIAAAFHVLRWRSHSEEKAHPSWEALDPSPYTERSLELGWLRRNTNYLFNSTGVALRALLSILYGLTVNLVFVLVSLAAIAWWLSWFFTVSGSVVHWSGETAAYGSYYPGWGGLAHLWVVLLVGPALFVLERVGHQLVNHGERFWAFLRGASVALLGVGVIVWALLGGLPWLLVTLHNFTVDSGSAVASLLYAIGLAPKSACAPLGTGLCGTMNQTFQFSATSSGIASVSAVVAAIIAVLRSASAKVPSAESSGPLGRLVGRLVGMVVHVLVPWTALAVVLLSGLSVEVRWIAGLLQSPLRLEQWSLVYRAATAFVAATVLTDVNWTSLHHFYRERLSSAFLLERVGSGLQPVPYAEPLRFSSAAPGPGAGPALVACAVANVSDSDIVPAKRNATPFTFSHDEIGLNDRLLPASRRSMAAAAYEFAADQRYRDVTIAAAMAMSGAAFSPLAGRLRRRIAPYRVVMALANARLGVWVANPMWADTSRCLERLIRLRRADDVRKTWPALSEAEQQSLRTLRLPEVDQHWLDLALGSHEPVTNLPRGYLARRRFAEAVELVGAWFSRPGAFRLLKEAFGTSSVFDRKLYITDGGHYDNLGLVEALRRRAKTIFVLDASNDAENTFAALGEAVATAKMDLDCTVDINVAPMVRPTQSREGRAPQAWARGKIHYPDSTEEGELFVIKALLADGLPLDAEVYAAQHADYPRTSTGDQLYGEFDFEAYRELGEFAARSLLDSLKPSGGRPARVPLATLRPPPGGDPDGRSGKGRQRQRDLFGADGQRRPKAHRPRAAR